MDSAGGERQQKRKPLVGRFDGWVGLMQASYPVGIVVNLDGQVLVHGVKRCPVLQVIREDPFVHHVVAEGVEQLDVNIADQRVQRFLKISKIHFFVLSLLVGRVQRFGCIEGPRVLGEVLNPMPPGQL